MYTSSFYGKRLCAAVFKHHGPELTEAKHPCGPSCKRDIKGLGRGQISLECCVPVSPGRDMRVAGSDWRLPEGFIFRGRRDCQSKQCHK